MVVSMQIAPPDFDRMFGALADHTRRDIVSGAGHDAAYLARVCPGGMFFIPCEGGLSHKEIENATFADVAAGAQVLLDAILAADQRVT